MSLYISILVIIPGIRDNRSNFTQNINIQILDSLRERLELALANAPERDTLCCLWVSLSLLWTGRFRFNVIVTWSCCAACQEGDRQTCEWKIFGAPIRVLGGRHAEILRGHWAISASTDLAQPTANPKRKSRCADASTTGCDGSWESLPLPSFKHKLLLCVPLLQRPEEAQVTEVPLLTQGETGTNTVGRSVARYGIHLHHSLTVVFQRSKNIT